MRINDRGPYADGRVIDLTPGAARHVGIDREEGLARVRVKAVEPPTPSGNSALDRER